MTGLERNADVVRMASYAPLFAHEDAWQWRPNLIWTDNLHVVPTPNYYVQQMYTHNRGDAVLPVTNDAPVKEMLPAGRIGVGTTRAAAEFKDVIVTDLIGAMGGDPQGRGSAEATQLGDWTQNRGRWRMSAGAFQQADANADGSSSFGETSWRNYTLTLKARKLGGEGSIVITVCDDDAGSRAQWILGGWDNKQHAIQTHFAEQDQLLGKVDGSLEPNRWYDVKIVLRGAEMKCYLDGKLIQSAEILHHRVPALFTAATRDDKTGETILKVVNPGDDASEATIKLSGVTHVEPMAQAVVLSGDPADENSVARPNHIEPKTRTVTGAAPDFKYTFPPESFTVLRLKTD